MMPHELEIVTSRKAQTLVPLAQFTAAKSSPRPHKGTIIMKSDSMPNGSMSSKEEIVGRHGKKLRLF